MNPFDVSLSPDAEAQLTDLWVRLAALRPAITAAEAKAYRQLTNDPLACGRSVSEGLRRLEAKPLVFFYSVESVARTVSVSNVYLLP